MSRIELAVISRKESRNPPTDPGSLEDFAGAGGGGRSFGVLFWRLIEDVAGHQRRPHAI